MLQAIARTFLAIEVGKRRLSRNESGSIATFMVVVPVIAGMVALGVETGQFYRVKRQMQGAADAAAISGSIDKLAGKTSAVIATEAKYEAQRNGFTDGTGGVVVTVNSPPTSGSNAGTTGAVEVIITKTQRFSIGGVLYSWLGIADSGFTMKARSVAAQGSYSSTTTSYEACLVALTTAAEQGVSLTSFNNFNSDCTIASNSTATGSGSNASITMSSFNNATLNSVWTRGSFSASSYNHIYYTNPSAPLTNRTTSVSDPYAGLAAPSPGTCTYTNFTPPSGNNITINPGTYCGGLSLTNKSNVYFTPGTYYIANGDLYISSDNNISCPTCTSGAGTTFVITQTTGNNSDIGGVRITSDNNVTLTAPSSTVAAASPATYPFGGVLFYQDRNVATGTMTSTSKIFTISSLNNATLSGAIYFPNNRIDIASVNNFGGNSTNGCTVWIGRYIKFSSFNNNYKAGCASLGTTPAGVTTTTTTNIAKVVE